MRNYIILNGVNSNTIPGLLISELPPITKPKIRTQVEEIDGRDGDILTKLGYSAYDKTIKIGLYDDFDIDDIISFFNSEGTVVFSNEEDKYYNYQIVNQIDFERLVRFRTADVTLHCQPFKYSTTEEKIQINATEVSGSGSNITLNNTENGANFTDIKIKGDTEQDGEPTPDNPVEVKTVTGDNTVTLCGKNLFDKNNETYTSAYISGSSATKLAPSSYNRTLYIKCLPNTIYTIQKMISVNVSKFFIASSVDIPSADVNIYNVVNAGDNNTSATYTTTSNAKYLLVNYIQTNTTTTTVEEMLSSIMIEKGSTASPYEPYQSQSYEINLSSLELCKIGDYQDYIYNNNGTWYKHSEIGKVVLNGSEDWDIFNGALFCPTTINYLKQEGITTICEFYKGANNVNGGSGAYNNGNNTIELYYPTSYNRIYLRDDRFTNGTDFKTWLSSNNVTVYCVLATHTDTEITDTTLLNDLELFNGATTYLGQTNIITSGAELDPLLDVTTYAVDNPSFTITNNGNIYSKPIITVYGLGTVGLYLNGNQVLNLDMGATTSQITIDVANMEAYNQETGALMNRSVTGNYNNLSLNVGDNVITESGTLQGLEVEKYSRWL